MYKQHSIVNTGNFNADFKFLTLNRYSVLNGHFVRQNHPSSLPESSVGCENSLGTSAVTKQYFIVLCFPESLFPLF